MSIKGFLDSEAFEVIWQIALAITLFVLIVLALLPRSHNLVLLVESMCGQ